MRKSYRHIPGIFILTLAVVFVLLYHDMFSQKMGGKNTSGGVRTIYLIRHGEYDHQDNRDEFTGKGLIPLGIAQARLVAERLHSIPVKMTALISSTMTRAVETAKVINGDFPDLELIQSPLIHECLPSTWREDVMKGENPDDIIECERNLDSAFVLYFIPTPDENDRNDIIVCHGNVIRYFVTKVLKVDSKAWLGMTISNCSITVVNIFKDGSMKLVSFNDAGHIPLNMRTETGGKNEIKQLKLPE